MNYAPITEATVEQMAAYFSYAREKRDLGAVLWGILFLLVCILPAILIDLFLLPTIISVRRSKPTSSRDGRETTFR